MISPNVKYLTNSGDGRIGQRGIGKFCPLCSGEGVISLGPEPPGCCFLPHHPPQEDFQQCLETFSFIFYNLGELGCGAGCC